MGWKAPWEQVAEEPTLVQGREEAEVGREGRQGGEERMKRTTKQESTREVLQMNKAQSLEKEKGPGNTDAAATAAAAHHNGIDHMKLQRKEHHARTEFLMENLT